MKKKNIIIIGFILLLILTFFIVVFVFNNKYEITFDTNGGSPVQKIKISKKDNFTLPESPTKEGYIFGGFVYENKLVTGLTKFDSNVTLKVRWIKEDADVINITYVIDDKTMITINVKGDTPIFIDVPVKDGYKMIGWTNEEGYSIDDNTILTSDVTLKPRFIKDTDETYKISFNSDNDSKVNDIIVVRNSKIVLPIVPNKRGYKFDGWIKSDNTKVTSDTIVDSDMTLTAKWIVPYTCPGNCVPSDDMKTCTKTLTSNAAQKKSCSSGYKLKNNKCLNYSKKYHADNTGGWHCKNKSDYMYTEEDGVGGAFMWCVPTTSVKTTKTCNTGYTLKNDTCIKTETINCTKN